jgi:hypothetical protein
MNASGVLAADAAALNTNLAFLPLTGGTLTGQVSQTIAPTAAGHLANKAYVDSKTVADATTTVKGVVQLAGDLVGVATAPLVGDKKITNAKMNPGVATTLKGTVTAAAGVVDVTLGTGLSMNASGVLAADAAALNTNLAFLPLTGGTLTGQVSQTIAPTAADHLANKAYVDSKTVADATTTVKGVVQLAGDLVGVATAPLVGDKKITNAKMNPGAATTLKGTVTVAAGVTDIVLGPSMSITGSTVNSSTSFFNGSNPSTTAPTDRPATTKVLYVGTNGSMWIYNGTNYVGTFIQQFPYVSKNLQLDEELQLETIHVRPTQFGAVTRFQIYCDSPSSGNNVAAGAVTVYAFTREEDNSIPAGGAVGGGQYTSTQIYSTWKTIPNERSFTPTTIYPGSMYAYLTDLNTYVSYELIMIAESVNYASHASLKRLTNVT